HVVDGRLRLGVQALNGERADGAAGQHGECELILGTHDFPPRWNSTVKPTAKQLPCAPANSAGAARRPVASQARVRLVERVGPPTTGSLPSRPDGDLGKSRLAGSCRIRLCRFRTGEKPGDARGRNARRDDAARPTRSTKRLAGAA